MERQDHGWMEQLLFLLLPERNRETVSGDLLEERKARAAESSPMQANLWYIRQVLSFLPARFATAFTGHPALLLLCFFTALSGTWLGAVDLRLHRAGYLGREVIAATIVLEALITLTALLLPLRSLRILALVGTGGILWLAGKAFVGLITGKNFEGYILLIALALIAQSCLTWFSFPRLHRPARRT